MTEKIKEDVKDVVDEKVETGEDEGPEPNLAVQSAFIVAVVGNNKTPDGEVDERSRGQIIAQPIGSGHVISLGDDLIASVENTANQNDIAAACNSLLSAINRQNIVAETVMNLIHSIQQAQSGVTLANKMPGPKM